MAKKKNQNGNPIDGTANPEMRIELSYQATRCKSVIGFIDASEIVVMLEGAKKFIEDHMILVYLDKQNLIMGIDAFFHNVEELMRGEPNRALSRTITHFSSSSRVDQVVIVQALPQTENPTIESIKPEFLANIAAKMSLFDILTNDIILMGTKGYFSYKENDQAWKVLQKALKHQQDFLGITR